MKKIMVELWVEENERDFFEVFDEVMIKVIVEESTQGSGDVALGSYSFKVTEE